MAMKRFYGLFMLIIPPFLGIWLLAHNFGIIKTAVMIGSIAIWVLVCVVMTMIMMQGWDWLTSKDKDLSH